MKIFRPILQIYKKILMAFLREQRNAVPVIAKQIAAINRRKPDYSGYFGTPEGIRTPDTRLRRAVLCPAELLAHMQFLFVSVTPAVENPPNVRRRTLYPAELRTRMEFFGPLADGCARGGGWGGRRRDRPAEGSAGVTGRIPNYCTPTPGGCQRERGILGRNLVDFFGNPVARGIFLRYNKWSGVAAKSA